MKKCTRCKECFEKEVFPILNKLSGKMSSMCSDCKREYDREHYIKHKEKNIIAKTRNAKNLRERNLRFLVDYLKSHPCVDCGEDDFIVLEFDHQHSKIGNISNMKNNCSLETLKNEIAKCEVVCANCHNRRSAKQFGYYKTIGENI